MANTKTRNESYRSAETGRYITRREAERKPRESVRETNHRGHMPQKGRK